MLNARADWLNAFADANPEWKAVVSRLVESNTFVAVPASMAWKDGDVEDSHLAVQERGVKGPPPAFKIEGDVITCVNYPGSFDPMTSDEFIKFATNCCAEWPADDEWMKKFLARP